MAVGASSSADTPKSKPETSGVVTAAQCTADTAAAADLTEPEHVEDAAIKHRKNPQKKLRSFGARLLAAVIAVAVFALYNYYSSQQLLHWVTPSWDLAIFTQMAQAYSHVEAPIVPIKGPDFNLWGDHFHPILMLLGPVYAFFPSPFALLMVQNGMIAASVYLMVRFSQRALPGYSGHVAGALLGAAFGLSYGVQQAVAAQFHEVAFALPFLTLSLGNLVLAGAAQNPERASFISRACWWAAPLAFVKEDMGITAAAIGVVALVRSGWLGTAANILFPQAREATSAGFTERLKKLGATWAATRGAAHCALLILWGVFWSWAAVTIILPLFNVNHRFDYADNVSIVGTLRDPLWAIIRFFIPAEKAWSLLLLVLAGAVLWVLSPLAAITLPTLAWRMLSAKESYWLSTWHYSLVLMPVVFLALLDMLVRIQRYSQQAAEEETADAVTADGAADAASTLNPYKSEQIQVHHTVRQYVPEQAAANRVRPVLARILVWALPAVALAIAVGPSIPSTSEQPLAQLRNAAFTSGEPTSEDYTKKHAVDAVPIGASVATDLSVLTEMIPGRTVYWIGHQGEPAPEYVVIDRAGTAWGGKPPADVAQYAADRYGHPYVQVKRAGTIDVVRRADTNK